MHNEVTGTIFQIQRFSVHDGEGLRTTVFFKGCPLRCRWCHNPEGLRYGAELALNRELCALCGRCAAVCPQSVHDVSPVGHQTNREVCSSCGLCARACPTGALSIVGRTVSACDVVREALRDSPFYVNGGGITCSGGECTAQPHFLIAVLRCAREAGLNTAVDTCGYAPAWVFARLLPLTDAFLYDIKTLPPSLHKAYTGVDNGRILSNYRMLHRNRARLDVRVPLIPTVNDTVEQITRIGEFLLDAGIPHTLKVIPYHLPGHGKYAQLDRSLWHPPAHFEVEPDEAQRMLDNMLYRT